MEYVDEILPPAITEEERIIQAVRDSEDYDQDIRFHNSDIDNLIDCIVESSVSVGKRITTTYIYYGEKGYYKNSRTEVLIEDLTPTP